jgi:cytochrome P450
LRNSCGVTVDAAPPLSDPAYYAGDPSDIHATYARLRAEDPVHWHAEGEFWALSRHADIVAVSRDPASFCSSRGVLMEDRKRGVMGADSILFLDPPRHQQLRNLVSRGFHPRQVNALEPRIRQMADELLDAIAPNQTVDWVETVAVQLPILVIADMLGIPRDDHEKFRVWSDALIEVASDLDSPKVTMAAELFAYFDTVIAERRDGERGTDTISVLVEAEVDGERLDHHELLGFCMTLLVAGNETTRNLLSGGVLALAERPDAWEQLRADLLLVPSAVEELLRWVTPIMTFARTATRANEVGGHAVAEGDYVLMLYASGNRDEAAFGPTASELDLTRRPNPHLAFGFGEHFCLGAGLARLEARVLLEQMLARYGSVELAGPVQRMPSTLVNGIEHLPLTFAG